MKYRWCVDEVSVYCYLYRPTATSVDTTTAIAVQHRPSSDHGSTEISTVSWPTYRLLSSVETQDPCYPVTHLEGWQRDQSYLGDELLFTKQLSFFPFDQKADNMAEQPLVHFSLDFITKTWLGRLKAAELLFTFLTATIGDFGISLAGNGCGPKVSFLTWIAWIAFIHALIDMIIHLMGLWERLYWFFRHPAILCALCGLAVIGFLIGSCLMASCAKDSLVSDKNAAGASAFFGFVCLVLFSIETYIHFKIYRGIQEEAGNQYTEQSKGADFTEPPPPYSPPSGVVWWGFMFVPGCNFYIGYLERSH